MQQGFVVFRNWIKKVKAVHQHVPKDKQLVLKPKIITKKRKKYGQYLRGMVLYLNQNTESCV